MNEDLKIEIPDDPITAADTVGRAFRITRKHWLPLIKFFLIPICLNDIAATLLVWQPEPSELQLGPGVSYWLMAVSFILLLLSSWEIETRRFALLLYIAKAHSSLEEALKAAKKRLWLIFVLLIPVLGAEIFSECFFLLVQLIFRGLNEVDMPALMQANVALSILGLSLMLYMPEVAIGVINAFFVSILVFDKSSVRAAMSRFFRIGIPMFWYFAIYTFLLTLAHVVVLIPPTFTSPITFLLPRNLVATVFEFTLSIALETPIYSFLAAVITIGGACLYKQLCTSLEGQDILDKLKLLEAKS